MSTSSAPTVGALTSVARDRARAEAREVKAMLRFRDAEIARIKDIQPAMRRQVERPAISLTIGEAMRLSEGQVNLRLSVAETLRDRAPRSRLAFQHGQIDFNRARDIARTIDKLQRSESAARLDERVIDYAIGHTAAELRVWLRRFLQRIEGDLAVERADAERDKRNVSVAHVDDGMAWLNAYLPSHRAADIESRLHREARRANADDNRTVSQREADLLVAWCTHSEATTSSTNAHIAVMIDADVLAKAIGRPRWRMPGPRVHGPRRTMRH